MNAATLPPLALETTGLEKRFGGLVATSNVSLSLKRGARQALIGPNGAGKTTLINLLTGVLSPSAGSIRLDGEDITHLRQDGRVRRGLARTFQINQLFADLTPLETVSLAISEREGGGAGDGGRASARTRRRRARPPNSSTASSCRTLPGGGRAISPTDASGFSKSPPPWRCARAFSCSTSRRRACRKRSVTRFSPS